MSDPAIAHHDRLAAAWDRRYASGSFARRARFFETRILPGLAPAGDWLDAGCGSGYFARMLAARGARVTGVDGSAEMIAEACRLAGPEGEGPAFRKIGTVAALPFEAASFDGVLSLSVLEYLPDPGAALAEFARVLRPGGWLAVSVPARRSPLRALQGLRWRGGGGGGGGADYLSVSQSAWTRGGLAGAAEAAGLAPGRIAGFSALPGGLTHGLAPDLYFLMARRRDQ